MAEATQEELDRFMSYVDKLPNGCWFWTGGRSRGKGNRKWYGSFWFRGKTIRAHKFACDFIGHFEPLPPGQHRDHTCVFSLCVNPEHLEKVTPKVNQERKVTRLAVSEPEWQGIKPYVGAQQRHFESHIYEAMDYGKIEGRIVAYFGGSPSGSKVKPFTGPVMRGPLKEAIKARVSMHPAWQRLKAAKLWPFDEPDYELPAIGVKTVGYGCG